MDKYKLPNKNIAIRLRELIKQGYEVQRITIVEGSLERIRLTY